jgi:diaminopimelate epimerase
MANRLHRCPCRHRWTWETEAVGNYACEKYEGLGNDFLIVRDENRTTRFDQVLIRHLCNRHTGIGADGLIRLSQPINKGAVRMELRNADGSFAETSGNGLRCAALAARYFGFTDADSFQIETEVSVASAAFLSGSDNGNAEISVSMGQVTVSKTPSPIEGFAAYRANVGNPHLVLIGKDISAIDIADMGPKLEHSEPGGLNVEVIAPTDLPDDLDLVVWERGAGLTQACGSGSCAAAAAAQLEGLTGHRVVVHNPGGAVSVELTGTDQNAPFAALIGPARRIARIEIDENELSRWLEERVEVTA